MYRKNWKFRMEARGGPRDESGRLLKRRGRKDEEWLDNGDGCSRRQFCVYI